MMKMLITSIGNGRKEIRTLEMEGRRLGQHIKKNRIFMKKQDISVF